jgi:inhibitor of cysteine peptidase
MLFSEQDSGRRVPARVGDEFQVRLPEAASAGYRWELESHDASRLEAIEATARYPKGRVGSGGEATFRFRVIAPGSTALTLKYWRDFEGLVLRRFEITVDAAP